MADDTVKPDWMVRGALLIAALTPIWFALATFWLPIGTREGSIVREFGLPIFFIEVMIVIVALLRVGLPRRDSLVGWRLWLVPSMALIGLAFLSASLGPGDPDIVAMGFVRAVILCLNLAFLASLVALLKAPGSLCRITLLRAFIVGMLGFVLLMVFYVRHHLGDAGFSWRYFGLGSVNIRNLSFYTSWAAPMIACLWLVTKDAHRRAYLALALVTIFTIAFWSGTRSIPFAALCAFVALLLAGRFSFAAKAGALMLVSALVSIPLAGVFPAPDKHFSAARMVKASDGSNGEIGAGRIAVWMQAVDEIKARPIIGHGEMRYALPMSDVVIRHPHQFILQWLHAWGILGTLVALGLLAAALWRIYRNAVVGNGVDLAVWGGLSALLGVAMIDGALFHPYPTMMVMMLMALGLARRKTVTR